jgi:Flp pilus assembly protein TadB
MRGIWMKSLFDLICDASYKFPKLRVGNKRYLGLKFIKPDIDEGRYICTVLVVAIAISVFIFTISSRIEAAAASCVVVTAILLLMPKIEFNRRKAKIEAELPFFLRNFAMLIDMGIPFQQAMGMASQGLRGIESEVTVVLTKVKNGISMQKSLAETATTFNSMTIKRAWSQLILLYETGGSGAELRKTGDDIMSLERHRLKDYAAKSSIVGLIFVMASAILPTFFIIYAIMGSIGLGAEINRVQMTIFLILVFPAISALLLILSKTSMPDSIFTDQWFDPILLLPMTLMAAGAFFDEAKLLFFSAGLIAGIYLAVKNFQNERKTEQIEEKLPDALFAVSGMPKSAGIGAVLRVVAEGGFGELSIEFRKAEKQFEMNMGIETVTKDLAARNNSAMLTHAAGMIRRMVNTNSLNRVSELADDIIRYLEIKRERCQIMATQKYTLMLGAILVPAILKTVLGLITTMSDAIGTEVIGEISADCYLLIPTYLVIYSSMVSISIADSEGRKSAASVYMVVLTIVSLITFYFINI